MHTKENSLGHCGGSYARVENKLGPLGHSRVSANEKKLGYSKVSGHKNKIKAQQGN